MKKVFLIMMILLSTAHAGEDEQKEIEALKARVAKLEQLVSYLLNNNNVQNNTRRVIVQQNVKPKSKYRVTLHDDTTFLIYKWDRQSYKRYNQRTGKYYYEKKYIMYDTFGKKRIWSCDKVVSIDLVEES